jgi:hypothetical protein
MTGIVFAPDRSRNPRSRWPRAFGARALSVAIVALAWAGAGSSAAAPVGSARATDSSSARCSGDYARGPLAATRMLRFGIDPEPAGSAGRTQNSVAPADEVKTLRALRSLRPHGKQLVLRVNRLFEADGAAGIRRFKRIIDGYTRAGFDTELQVRYHPSSGQAGDIAAWTRYVRHVVDVFGPNPHLIAMTITNEVNIGVSPNTSDGAYPHAEQALVQGIIAAHREAQRHGLARLRFGFTYAYRFNAMTDAALFTGLRTGGRAFRDALGFVGVDYYPELYPGRATPIPEATRLMMGTVRRCFMPLGALGARVPIWITENGYDTTPGTVTAERQRTALRQILTTIIGAARTFNVTDYRWFNLRDNLSTTPAFGETTGLLTDAYRRKPAFSAYRRLIARFGVRRSP